MFVRLGALAAVFLMLAACSGNGSDSSPTASPSDATKPTVHVPKGDPPTKIVIKDIRKGDGDEATAGSTVTVNYVGVSWSTHQEFDSSFGGDPATFPLDRVIKGWTDGIPGMKVGGRRELIIPPDLGYGHRGYPPDIAPDETLVFIIDLLGVS